jgi:hypothetical protein
LHFGQRTGLPGIRLTQACPQRRQSQTLSRGIGISTLSIIASLVIASKYTRKESIFLLTRHTINDSMISEEEKAMTEEQMDTLEISSPKLCYYCDKDLTTAVANGLLCWHAPRH